MHDPFAGFQISCDWTCHVTRTPPSSGGTDYRMGTGTPIRAAFAGVLTNRPPAQFPNSGNVAILTASSALAASFGVPSLAFYHLHLSAFAPPGPVAEGDIIGYSGNTGFSTGPHLHINAYVGNTPRDVHDFYLPTTTAGSGGTPITGDEMALLPDERAWLQNLASAVPSIILTLKDVDLLLKMAQTPVNRDKGDGAGVLPISQLQDNADTNTLVREALTALAALAARPSAAGTVDLAPVLAAINALPKSYTLTGDIK